MKSVQSISAEPQSSPRNPATSQGELFQLYFWAPADQEIPPMAKAMATDLLSGSRCELIPSPGDVVSARFDSVVLAVKAARQMQHLMRGFYSSPQTGSLGACVVLSAAREAAPELDFDVLRRTAALHETLPCQTLIVGGLAKKVEALPGLKLEKLPAGLVLRDSKGKARAVSQLLPATDVSAQPLPTKVLPEAVTVTPKAAPVVVPPKVSVPLTHVPTAPTEPVQEPRIEKPMVAGPAYGGWGSGKKLWGAVAGVAALALCGGIIFATSHKTAAPVTRPAQNQTPSPVVAAPPEPPGKAEPSPAAATVVGKSVPPAPVTAAPKAKASKQESRPAEQEEVEDAKPTKAGRGVAVMFTPAEIRYLLARADKDSGDGNFDKAIDEYRAVLKQDPKNSAAREGLGRAIRNKGGR